jgi:Fe-S oxidoreductase
MQNINLSSIIKIAPRYLTRQYGALNSYVWEGVFPRESRNRALNKIKDESKRKEKFSRMKDIVDEATLLTFIFVTRKVLMEGTEAAKNAVDTLKSIGVKEFYLGKAKFSGRNENVMQGERLAGKLFSSLNKDMQGLISNSNFMSDIINKYKNIDH